jgi:hypothetical protein
MTRRQQCELRLASASYILHGALSWSDNWILDSWFFDIGFPHTLIPSKIDGVYLKGGQKNVRIFHRALLNMKQVSGIVRRFINVEETKPTETLKKKWGFVTWPPWIQNESSNKGMVSNEQFEKKSTHLRNSSNLFQTKINESDSPVFFLSVYIIHKLCYIIYILPFDDFKAASFGINPCAAWTPLFKWLNQQKTKFWFDHLLNTSLTCRCHTNPVSTCRTFRSKILMLENWTGSWPDSPNSQTQICRLVAGCFVNKI